MSTRSPAQLKERERRTLLALEDPQPFTCGAAEQVATTAASSGGSTVRRMLIERRKRLDATEPHWGYYGREVTVALDRSTTPVTGGWASDAVQLAQGAEDEAGPQISTPTPGTVLEPDASDEVVFDWPDVAGASNYRISMGTTLDGTDVVNAATSASSTYTLDAGDLPGDGSVIYVLVEAYVDSAWVVNRYMYLDSEYEAHLAINDGEANSVSDDADVFPGVAASDLRKRTLPTGTKLMPVGGPPDVEPVPTGEAATEWSYLRNPKVVPFVLETRGGKQVAVFAWPNTHDIVCGATDPEPEDSSLAVLASPAADATLGSTSVTITITGIAGAAEYWLVVKDATSDYGDEVHYDASLGTGTSQAVTDLPDDGRLLLVEVWSKVDEEPHWRHNAYHVTAYTA